MTQKVAFFGLGNMGVRMASNLARSGYAVIGFDVEPSACETARSLGVAIAANPAAAVDGAGVAITMLPTGKHVAAVWTDLAGSVKPGALAIDCSTIDIDSCRRAHTLLTERGCLTLDAPVSGGTGGATEATLTFMVGGLTEAFSRGEPILRRMGRRIIHCGDAGAGQAAKICNNMLLGISMAGVCEAFALGEKLGLSHQALFDVASTSSGQCWSLTAYCPVPGPVPASPANRDYKPGFTASLMLKDLKLSQQAAAASGASTPLGAEAARIYGLFDRLGHGGDDFSGLIRLLRADENRQELSHGL